jgi:hypothetical protein
MRLRRRGSGRDALRALRDLFAAEGYRITEETRRRAPDQAAGMTPELPAMMPPEPQTHPLPANRGPEPDPVPEPDGGDLASTVPPPLE